MIKHKMLPILLIVVLTLGTLGFSADAVMKINASLANDFAFKVDGAVWQPYDTDGSILKPIIYNNRSYVPAKALLEKFGIGVGYDSPTRTILLTSKEYDKSSPILANMTKPDTASLPLTVEYDATRASAYGTPKLTQTTTIELATDAEVWINGAKSTMTFEELAASAGTSISKAKVSIDRETGLVEKVEYDTTPDGGEPSALKVTITITISTKPLVITITIRF